MKHRRFQYHKPRPLTKALGRLPVIALSGFEFRMYFGGSDFGFRICFFGRFRALLFIEAAADRS